MIPSNQPGGASSGDFNQLYIEAFIRRAHEVLAAGYEQMKAAAYQSREEDEITGDLKVAMNRFLSEIEAGWARSLFVHEQVPVNTPGEPGSNRRVGKSRPKIDLQFVANASGGFHHFSWEAKRLGNHHPVSGYLGKDGLGCFLSGAYAAEVDFGGMLGYIQSEDVEAWTGRIQKRLHEDGLAWSTVGSPTPTRRAVHRRQNPMKTIAIYHTLLSFC